MLRKRQSMPLVSAGRAFKTPLQQGRQDQQGPGQAIADAAERDQPGALQQVVVGTQQHGESHQG